MKCVGFKITVVGEVDRGDVLIDEEVCEELQLHIRVVGVGLPFAIH